MARSEIRRSTAEDLIFLFETAGLTSELGDLGLLGGRDPIDDTVIDVGLGHPPLQRGLGDPDIGAHLSAGPTTRM